VQLDDAAMNAIVAIHFIQPSTLRADDFDAFYAARKASLIALVERAMAKSVAAMPADILAADEHESAAETVAA
jgi:hypothetical protein